MATPEDNWRRVKAAANGPYGFLKGVGTATIVAVGVWAGVQQTMTASTADDVRGLTDAFTAHQMLDAHSGAKERLSVMESIQGGLNGRLERIESKLDDLANMIVRRRSDRAPQE